MKRILVLDDDDAILCTLETALNMLNYQVKCLKDERGLFRAVCEFQPDVLVLDFMLNSANGGALCHQIKSNPEFSCLPVIMMSGYEDVAELAAKAGSDSFLKKPFNLTELDDKIEMLLNKRSNSLFGEFT